MCFVHVDLELEMRFSPQRRALFRQLNFQKCSEHEIFLAFSLANVLRATIFSDHVWKLRCRKSERCCGTKHISKSKVLKTVGFEHFWTFRCRFCVAGTKDSASLPKVSKAYGFRGSFNYKQHSTTLHSATSTTPTAITHITLH